jgi:hypothetical protein
MFELTGRSRDTEGQWSSPHQVAMHTGTQQDVAMVLPSPTQQMEEQAWLESAKDESQNEACRRLFLEPQSRSPRKLLKRTSEPT